MTQNQKSGQDPQASLSEVSQQEYDQFVQKQQGLQKDTSSGTHEYSKDKSGKVVAGKTTGGGTPRYYISKPGSGSGQQSDQD